MDFVEVQTGTWMSKVLAKSMKDVLREEVQTISKDKMCYRNMAMGLLG